ncbi:MAG: hypothetical protein L3K17_01305 [Thermoplasmata archaeon]|nr:hypothetical protein [Thermoplasmata archaeon]
MFRRRAHRKRVLRCPQCESTHLIFETAGIVGQVYHCLDCDYVGSLVLETEEPSTSKPSE